MSRVQTFVAWHNAATNTDVSLSADTDTPVGPGPVTGVQLLTPLVASWAIDDILPPLAKPATATFQVFDDGDTYSTLEGQPIHVPLDIGDPCAVYVVVDNTPSVFLQGRISDASAVNRLGGGVVHTVVVADRLADLASNGAPTPLAAANDHGPYDYYDQLIAAEDLDLTYAVGTMFTDPWILGQEIDLTNVNLLDALNRIIQQDNRLINAPPFSGLDPNGNTDVLAFTSRYLTIDVDTADPTPILGPVPYILQEWDPRLDILAGILELVFSAGLYRLVVNEDYYLMGHEGMVLTASQLLADVGEWRKTRTAALNTVELNGTFEFPGPTTTLVRRQLAELVAAYGRNTRTMAGDMVERGDAQRTGDILLGVPEQVQLDYGLAKAVLLYDQLTADQKSAAWTEQLWPRFYDPSGEYGSAYGLPVAITDIPASWRLVRDPIVAARLMGVTWTIDGTDVVLELTMRGIRPVTGTGVTWAGMPGPITWALLDPTITWQQLTLVED